MFKLLSRTDYLGDCTGLYTEILVSSPGRFAGLFPAASCDVAGLDVLGAGQGTLCTGQLLLLPGNEVKEGI